MAMASQVSIPKSCMEIQELFPNSPSGFYTINDGISSVVYCKMDELYSCRSLEQTLKGLSKTLSSNDVCEKISTSCQEMKDKCPDCTSGYYKILTANIREKYVYCNFTEAK